MREIKFRAWNKKGVYANTMVYQDGPDLDGVIYYTTTVEGQDVYYNFEDIMDSKYFILMQYTGLKDKNGKEIYEGDVFTFHPSKEWVGTEPENPCVVFWSNSLCAFMFYVGEPDMSTLLPPSESIEIIGNIYENPELLKKK